MEKIYLKNCQEANLIKEIDGQYLVDPYEYYQDYDGEDYNEPSGSLQIVDKVFKTPPLPVIDEEYRKLTEKINNTREESNKLERELYSAKHELSKVQGAITDASKYIINRKEISSAKRITFFSEEGWMPTDWTPKSSWGTKISATISIRTGEEVFWTYKLYEDYDSSSDNIDKKYGFLLDKTDEEIEQITKDRISYYESVGIDKLSSYTFSGVDDKYLSESLIEKKNIIIKEKAEADRIKTEKEIADLTSKLERLKEQGGIYPTKGKK